MTFVGLARVYSPRGVPVLWGVFGSESGRRYLVEPAAAWETSGEVRLTLRVLPVVASETLEMIE